MYVIFLNLLSKYIDLSNICYYYIFWNVHNNLFNIGRIIHMSSLIKFWPFLLLVISNIFMTFAWYGNLRFKDTSTSLPIIILISWGIAFFEYCFMIPANRIASRNFDTAQLKIIQEAITLIVFGFFSVFYLKESFKLNYLLSFVCILGAVFFAFKKF